MPVENIYSYPGIPVTRAEYPCYYDGHPAYTKSYYPSNLYYHNSSIPQTSTDYSKILPINWSNSSNVPDYMKTTVNATGYLATGLGGAYAAYQAQRLSEPYLK